MNKENLTKMQRGETISGIVTPPTPFDLCIRKNTGVYEYPVHHMRGGTSTGLILWERLAPKELKLREELLCHLMGVPLEGDLSDNRQITGLGRGNPTSNKVFFVDVETADGCSRLVSNLAQLAAHTSAIDWRVNCGNMSAAIPLWALDVGITGQTRSSGEWSIDIRNLNTGVVTTAKLNFNECGMPFNTSIPGVSSAFPSIDLFLHEPVGTKTGKLLPTGKIVEQVNGYKVTCIDVAVPMVILDASEFGKTAHETIDELEADQVFMSLLRGVWIEAGFRMGLKGRNGAPMTREEVARSETVPKVCIVGKPRFGGHVATRYFTPQTGHASLAVSGACCIAAATLLSGSVAQMVAERLPTPCETLSTNEIIIENPAGNLVAKIISEQHNGLLEVHNAAYRRSAQILLRGYVPLYGPSENLSNWLAEHASSVC